MPQPIALYPVDHPHAPVDPAAMPTITVFPAAQTGPAQRPAMLVFPGGGYHVHADHEADPFALWFNQMGIHGLVVRYRLAPSHHHPDMLHDAARAIRWTRAHAAELGVDKNRVGVIGFSAGGHLAATISTQFDDGDAAAADEIDRHSSRPDLAVLAYPLISMITAPHAGSRLNLLGPTPTDNQLRLLSPEQNVRERTPPTFIFHTADDPVVPVTHSLLYAQALRDKNIACELHVYESGRHGVGFAADNPVLRDWTRQCQGWLKSHAFGV
jgi:acetyl esterase/lipase